MGGGLFAVSLFLQSVMQLNALNTGLTTLPITIGLLIFAIAAPSLANKFSHKTLIAAGCIIINHWMSTSKLPIQIRYNNV